VSVLDLRRPGQTARRLRSRSTLVVRDRYHRARRRRNHRPGPLPRSSIGGRNSFEGTSDHCSRAAISSSAGLVPLRHQARFHECMCVCDGAGLRKNIDPTLDARPRRPAEYNHHWRSQVPPNRPDSISSARRRCADDHHGAPASSGYRDRNSRRFITPDGRGPFYGKRRPGCGPSPNWLSCTRASFLTGVERRIEHLDHATGTETPALSIAAARYIPSACTAKQSREPRP